MWQNLENTNMERRLKKKFMASLTMSYFPDRKMQVNPEQTEELRSSRIFFA